MQRDLTDSLSLRYEAAREVGLKEPVYENLELPEHFGPVHLQVDDHKVKRFAFTMDEYHPWSFGLSPFGGRIGQAGLLANDLLQLFTLKYAASLVAGLHTEEQFWFDSPVHVGEVVSLEGTYVERYVRRGQGYVVMEASASGEDGRSIIRHRGVEIFRTRPGEIVGRGAVTDHENYVTGEFDESLPYLSRAGSGVVTGMPLHPLRRVITQEQASVFSRCGEYVKNIHNDLDRALAAGLRIPIVQGQQQVCMLLNMLVQVFGIQWFNHGWIRCKFVRPAEVFEELTAGGVTTEVDTSTNSVKADFWVRGADGRLCTVGWARCLIPNDQPAITTPVPNPA